MGGANCKEKYNEYEKIIHQTMDQCFKKRKSCGEPKISGKYLLLYRKALSYGKKGKAERKVAKTYIQAICNSNAAEVAERTMKKIQNTIQNISIDNNFSPNGFWELCRNIRKKSGTIGTSIITESGNEVFSDELIADAYVKEFKHRLRQRQICPELKNYEERTKLLCQLYVEESRHIKALQRKTSKEPGLERVAGCEPSCGSIGRI